MLEARYEEARASAETRHQLEHKIATLEKALGRARLEREKERGGR